MNAQREAKMKAMRDAQPQKPKEITVIAGDGKQVRIQLGGEQKDQADNRKQVAEAAGLKHVPLPDFDDSDNSAWAGSLKKTAKTKMLTGRAGKRQTTIEEQTNLWTVYALFCYLLYCFRGSHLKLKSMFSYLFLSLCL